MKSLDMSLLFYRQRLYWYWRSEGIHTQHIDGDGGGSWSMLAFASTVASGTGMQSDLGIALFKIFLSCGL